MSDVSEILSRVDAGDLQAAHELLPLVYDELRKLASARLAQERPGQTLQATALVHEAYLRLIGKPAGLTAEADARRSTNSDEHASDVDASNAGRQWDGQGHFFAAAAEAMRRILVDQARRKGAVKHGGAAKRQSLEDAQIAAPEQDVDLLALDEALSKLAEADSQAAEIVKLRFFAGLNMKETAVALNLSERNAYYLWTYARTWLHRALRDDDATTPQNPGDKKS